MSKVIKILYIGMVACFGGFLLLHFVVNPEQEKKQAVQQKVVTNVITNYVTEIPPRVNKNIDNVFEEIFEKEKKDNSFLTREFIPYKLMITNTYDSELKGPMLEAEDFKNAKKDRFYWNHDILFLLTTRDNKLLGKNTSGFLFSGYTGEKLKAENWDKIWMNNGAYGSATDVINYKNAIRIYTIQFFKDKTFRIYSFGREYDERDFNTLTIYGTYKKLKF